jgi:hypothetical protein
MITEAYHAASRVEGLVTFTGEAAQEEAAAAEATNDQLDGSRLTRTGR